MVLLSLEVCSYFREKLVPILLFSFKGGERWTKNWIIFGSDSSWYQFPKEYPFPLAFPTVSVARYTLLKIQFFGNSFYPQRRNNSYKVIASMFWITCRYTEWQISRQNRKPFCCSPITARHAQVQAEQSWYGQPFSSCFGTLSSNRWSFFFSLVTLAQTTKKGMGRKQELAEDIREALENYQRVFVFSTNNMRNTALKEVRQEWKHSRYEQSPSNASRNSPPDSVCFPFSL